MKRFPKEFAEILSSHGKRILNGHAHSDLASNSRRPPLISLSNVIQPRWSRRCIYLLDRYLWKHLRPLRAPIPRQTITRMRSNYSELLPKTVRLRTCYLNTRHSTGYGVAEDIGLVAMLHSSTFKEFAEPPGCQVHCYTSGDYSGPHNDHHPEDPTLAQGYVDVHISFCNDAVAHQLLVYEERGYLSEALTVSTTGTITVYRLPFWHYTTPLIPKPRRTGSARRWLLIGSFELTD